MKSIKNTLAGTDFEHLIEKPHSMLNELDLYLGGGDLVGGEGSFQLPCHSENQGGVGRVKDLSKKKKKKKKNVVEIHTPVKNTGKLDFILYMYFLL